MTLLEPPIVLPGETPDVELEKELTRLVAAGRRGDAVEHFNRSIGVPDEYLVGMRQAPYWPTLEKLAHTLVYDSVITRSLDVEKLGTVTTPTVVIDSGASDDRFGTWADTLIRPSPECGASDANWRVARRVDGGPRAGTHRDLHPSRRPGGVGLV